MSDDTISDAEFFKDFDSDFKQWFIANQDVWNEFCEIADKVRSHGATRWSSDAITHIIRWQRIIAGKDGEFKINDHRTPYLARLYNRTRDVTFFEQRKLTSKRKSAIKDEEE